MGTRVRLFAARVFLLAVLCGAANAVVAAQELSPEADRAMRLGLAAANQQEWELAVRYFGEARQASPYAPEVLLNLALAHDRLGGREFLAIVWFRAFLASAPGAANAGQVRERLLELEVKVEIDVAKLIGRAKEAALRLPRRDEALGEIARVQADVGDLAGALATAARISDDYTKMQTYPYIARAQARAGDIAGAKMTAALPVFEQFFLSDIHADIARAEARAGDIAGARETIALAKERAARISDHYDKSMAYSGIAEEQAKAGDIAGARQSITLAEEAAARISERYASLTLLNRYFAYSAIAVAQAQAGDIHGAKVTLVSVRFDFTPEAYGAIAEAQVRAGDSAGALATLGEAREVAARISAAQGADHANRRIAAYRLFAEVQARAGDVAGAREELIKSWTVVATERLNAQWFVDFEGFIDSLRARRPKDAVRDLLGAARYMWETLQYIQQLAAE